MPAPPDASPHSVPEEASAHMAPHKRVAFAVAECAPWCMTGGLGDVAGALPRALRELGADVAVFLPLYRTVRERIYGRGCALQDTGAVSSVWFGAHRLDGRWFRILETVVPGSLDHEGHLPHHVPTFVFDCPVLYDRDGLYGHGDDCARFSTFCRAVLNSSSRLMGGPPDVIHCHDWHTALIPLFLEGPYRRLLPDTASVLTIHNLAYQGVQPAEELATTGLGPEFFTFERLEFYGRVNMLKGGLAAADALTTVSPRYAEEIRTPAFGERLEGVLRAHERRLHGIVNGIDAETWNPEADPHLPAAFNENDLAGKAICRRNLLSGAGMDPDDPHPVFGIVSRFARQKGLDLVAELVPWLAQRSVRLLVLGKGEKWLEEWFQNLALQYPHHLRVRLGHEPDLAHVLQAGADVFLMPSRYEPCGLSQLYAMRYGTVPIVHAVGGLRDTVGDLSGHGLATGTSTGFRFEHDTVAGLQWATDRALSVFYTEPDIWRQLQRNGMKQDFSWRRSGASYLDVYGQAMARRRHG